MIAFEDEKANTIKIIKEKDEVFNCKRSWRRVETNSKDEIDRKRVKVIEIRRTTNDNTTFTKRSCWFYSHINIIYALLFASHSHLLWHDLLKSIYECEIKNECEIRNECENEIVLFCCSFKVSILSSRILNTRHRQELR